MVIREFMQFVTLFDRALNFDLLEQLPILKKQCSLRRNTFSQWLFGFIWRFALWQVVDGAGEAGDRECAVA